MIWTLEMIWIAHFAHLKSHTENFRSVLPVTRVHVLDFYVCKFVHNMYLEPHEYIIVIKDGLMKNVYQVVFSILLVIKMKEVQLGNRFRSRVLRL